MDKRQAHNRMGILIQGRFEYPAGCGVAQLVERRPPELRAAGSSPVTTAHLCGELLENLSLCVNFH